MSKYIVIGDMHVTVNSLNDAKKLMSFVVSTAKEKKIENIIFLGDLFHTHGVIRVEVQNFWKESFEHLTSLGINTIALIGNHDMILGESKYAGLTSLDVFQQNDLDSKLSIIKEPTSINSMGFISYIHDKDEFIQEAHRLYELGAKDILFAHQNFTIDLFGDKIDRDSIPQKTIISGHVHDRSTATDDTFYTDTPMWLTADDANKEKGIWIITTQNGTLINKEMLSTRDVVTPINKFKILEGEELPIFPENAKNYVELIGKTAWINEIRKQLRQLNVNVSTKPTDSKIKIDRKESINDIKVFMDKYFKPMDGVSSQEILSYLGGLNV